MADKDAQLTNEPCLRRVGQWVLKESGVEDSQGKSFLTSLLEPPWSSHPGSLRITADMPTTKRQTDPSHKRRQAAECVLAVMPAPDCTTWIDGSVTGETTNGGGGAVVILHR